MRKMVFTVAAAAALCTGAAAAWAQQPIVYPSRGQSPQQQSADTGDCQVWATQTTGVNPANVAQQMLNQPQDSSSQSPPSGLLGALGGAGIGGIIGGGHGAGIGALVGGLLGGIRQHQRMQQQQQQGQASQQMYQGELGSYNRAFSACMQGRGYAVN